MLDLVYKDIVQGRKTILVYLVAGGALGLVLALGVTGVGSVLGVMAVFSTYGYAIRSTYDEDKNGALLFLKGLPLSDTAIVVSKYVSTLVVSLFLEVFFLGVAVASEGFISPRLGFGPSAGSPVDIGAYLVRSLSESGFIFSMVMVMLAIYLTMFFCLGYAKAAAYNRFVMLGIFAAVFAGFSVAQKLSPEPPAWVARLGQNPSIPALAAAAGVVIYGLGCVVSVVRVHSKDWS